VELLNRGFCGGDYGWKNARLQAESACEILGDFARRLAFRASKRRWFLRFCDRFNVQNRGKRRVFRVDLTYSRAKTPCF
jgi:hypothetical protein